MKEQMCETRRRVLVSLKREGPLTVDDLAKDLKVTTMAVRKHLTGLEQDGLATSILERRPVGRPRFLYQLTDLAEGLFPTSYPQLAMDLLEDVRSLYGEIAIQNLMWARLDRFARRHSHRFEGKAFSDRVRELAKLREEAGFLVDWDERSDHFIFREYNCSIYQVAKKHPEVCQCELSIFERLLDARITAPTCLARGDRFCQFVVAPREDVPLVDLPVS